MPQFVPLHYLVKEINQGQDQGGEERKFKCKFERFEFRGDVD